MKIILMYYYLSERNIFHCKNKLAVYTKISTEIELF